MGEPLLPCPFCGGDAFVFDRTSKGAFADQFIRVTCEKCGARGPSFHHATCADPNSAAITAWNTRKSGDEGR